MTDEQMDHIDLDHTRMRGEIVGAEFYPEDLDDGRIIVRVAVDARHAVGHRRVVIVDEELHAAEAEEARGAHDPTAPLRATPTTFQFQRQEVFTGAPMDFAHLFDHRAIHVVWRGGSTWAVQLGLGSPGRVWDDVAEQWEWEPIPSSRTEAFLARTRYPLEQALEIGARLAAEHAGT